VALYDFVGEQPEDLSFRAGEQIEVLQQNQNGWWIGKKEDQQGVFPFNYVEMH
jgi:myosin-1